MQDVLTCPVSLPLNHVFFTLSDLLFPSNTPALDGTCVYCWTADLFENLRVFYLRNKSGIVPINLVSSVCYTSICTFSAALYHRYAIFATSTAVLCRQYAIFAAFTATLCLRYAIFSKLTATLCLQYANLQHSQQFYVFGMLYFKNWQQFCVVSMLYLQHSQQLCIFSMLYLQLSGACTRLHALASIMFTGP
jgi:hypothetical protein